MTERAIAGCLWGTAVGDALGLPYEGLSPQRAARLLGPPDRYRFFFGRGMVSDDTEHTVLVAESLIESGGDVAAFERSLARRLRRWFLGFPAGIGMATAKACTKLTFGVSPRRSGIESAGNGAAMRSAILGVYASDLQQLDALVRVTTRITHTDPKAEWGAMAIALAAHCAKSSTAVVPHDYLAKLHDIVASEDSSEFIRLMTKAVEWAIAHRSPIEFANELRLGRGVGGYVFHCVPVVIHCWLTHQHDFRSAMETMIACGGDADTNAAMLGGIIGASVGVESIPKEWLERLMLFPMSANSLERLARQLATIQETGQPNRPISPPWIVIALRNLFFLKVVLFHGLRRLAPPY